MKENYPDYIEKVFTFKIPAGQAPERLDSFLTRSIINATRTRVQKAIDEGAVTVNGKPGKASKKIQPKDEIECRIMKPPPIELVPEDIPLEIVFEDEHLIIVNKPAGMCTHPGFGNRYGTLVNAVLYHLGFRESIAVEVGEDDDEERSEGEIYGSDSVRPGVVHRLDKDTSGLLVVSKNPVVHAKLAKLFFDRTIDREYYSLVWGTFEDEGGMYEGDIGRSSRDRKLFAVVKKDGKPAKTEFHVVERLEYLTLVRIKLHTGRTHQIRVHFSTNGHPVFGDPAYLGDRVVYGGHKTRFRQVAEKLAKSVGRQMLHARTLGFVHPETGEKLLFSAPIPKDMQMVIDRLKRDEE